MKSMVGKRGNTCFSDKVRVALSLYCDTTVIPNSSCQYSSRERQLKVHSSSHSDTVYTDSEMLQDLTRQVTPTEQDLRHVESKPS